mmetsp:Transcript_93967/g.236759  ORF Transcript_93967/g.236759 Transcript_93967/m.236759 type:complete len:992 (-) Transcript_93967:177-3152(-)
MVGDNAFGPSHVVTAPGPEPMPGGGGGGGGSFWNDDGMAAGSTSPSSRKPRPLEFSQLQRELGKLREEVQMLEECSKLREQIRQMKDDRDNLMHGMQTPKERAVGHSERSRSAPPDRSPFSGEGGRSSRPAPDGTVPPPQAPTLASSATPVAAVNWWNAPSEVSARHVPAASSLLGKQRQAVDVSTAMSATAGSGTCVAESSRGVRRSFGVPPPVDLSWAWSAPSPPSAHDMTATRTNEILASSNRQIENVVAAPRNTSFTPVATIPAIVEDAPRVPPTDSCPGDTGDPEACVSAPRGSNLDWAREETRTFCELFATLGLPKNGLAAVADVKEMLERTELPTTELSQIWQLSDVDMDGRLTKGEFVCAMHLASARRRGSILPTVVPSELADMCRNLDRAEQVGRTDVALPEASPSGEQHMRKERTMSSKDVTWTVDLEHAQRDHQNFVDIDVQGRGSISLVEGVTASQEVDIPRADFIKAWKSVDKDADGCLDVVEFIAMMQLARSLEKGSPLPSVVPEELLTACRSALAKSPNAEVIGQGIVQGQALVVDFDELNKSSRLFSDLDVLNTGAIDAAVAKTALESTGLPTEELARIWQLSDVDADGCLTRGEFVCAMSLASNRSRGLLLPDQLPEELATVCADFDATGQRKPESSLDGRALDLLTVNPEDTKRFCQMYDSLDIEKFGSLAADDARRALETTQLPLEDLAQIWQMSDVDADGRLTRGEFVCAMHLANDRRRGLQLPAQLPDSLIDVCIAVEEFSGGDRSWSDLPDAEHSQEIASAAIAPHDSFMQQGSSDLASSPYERQSSFKRQGSGGFASPSLARQGSFKRQGSIGFSSPAFAQEASLKRLGSGGLPGFGSARQASCDGSSTFSTGPVASPWLVTVERLEMYTMLFSTLVPGGERFVMLAEAQEVLSKSEVPSSEIERLWQLCGPDDDGRLSVHGFACAMHLVSARRAGLPMPVELPLELVTVLNGVRPSVGVGGAASAAT